VCQQKVDTLERKVAYSASSQQNVDTTNCKGKAGERVLGITWIARPALTMPDTVDRLSPQSNPTLEELGKARPPRSSGAPSRTKSHYDRILALLRERGSSGVLSSELYDAAHLYGRSPRNRISELRHDGHLIKTVPAGSSVVRYVLAHENPSPVERPPAKPAVEWEDRPRITGLPLFDLAVRR
jgi:hypothetical protein